MNKWFSLCLIVLSWTTNAHANSCKIEGYAIGFFNGVATSKQQALEGRKKIESTLGVTQYNGEPVEYQLFYNDSNSKTGCQPQL